MTEHVDAFLPELALDALDESERARVLAHVGGCAACADELRAYREALGTLPDALNGERPGGRASLLDALTPGLPDTRRFAGLRRRFARLYDLPDTAFDDVVSQLADAARWEQAMPGVGLFHFNPGPKHAGADAGFVRFAAGSRFPTHRHVGDEYMLIFQGGLRDDQTGHEARVGDLLLMPPGSSHSFTIFPDEDCLAAVLLHGGPPEIEGFEMHRK